MVFFRRFLFGGQGLWKCIFIYNSQITTCASINDLNMSAAITYSTRQNTHLAMKMKGPVNLVYGDGYCDRRNDHHHITSWRADQCMKLQRSFKRNGEVFLSFLRKKKKKKNNLCCKTFGNNFENVLAFKHKVLINKYMQQYIRWLELLASALDV